MTPIIDLHSDLLSYLANGASRTPHDPASRTAYPDLRHGKVKLQTLAIAATTSPIAVPFGEKQIASLSHLFKEHSDLYLPLSKEFSLDSSHIHLVPAVENASVISNEGEPLDNVFPRLESLIEQVGLPLYISLTWNGENRFGGGMGADVGLKDDGKTLLRYLDGRGIAIDLSHTSDTLAYDILNMIDKEGLRLSVMASHSNMRSITPALRNLPDDLVKELIRRKGVIGINLFAPFIGDPETLMKHVAHALELGAQDSLAFGADFFCETDFPDVTTRHKDEDAFFPDYGNSSAYPLIIQQLKDSLALPEAMVHAIGSGNVVNFLRRQDRL